MEGIEERLAKQVRKYPHLYNVSLPFYEDAQVALKSWGEISESIGLTVVECKARWKKTETGNVKFLLVANVANSRIQNSYYR